MIYDNYKYKEIGYAKTRGCVVKANAKFSVGREGYKLFIFKRVGIGSCLYLSVVNPSSVLLYWTEMRDGSCRAPPGRRLRGGGRHVSTEREDKKLQKYVLTHMEGGIDKKNKQINKYGQKQNRRSRTKKKKKKEKVIEDIQWEGKT